MKFSKDILLVITIMIASVSFISLSSGDTLENNKKSDIFKLLNLKQFEGEQSIIQRLQEMLIDSYVYYLKTSRQTETYTSIRMEYFPILRKNAFIDESQQPFHFEQYFSNLYASVGQAVITTSIKKERIIKISNLPVNKGFLSSRYGMRKDPINGLPKMHKGIDIATKYGAEVSPLGNGIITYAGYKLGYGNTVEIKHGKTVITRYAHLKQFLVNVDQQVTSEDIIGFVGNTGRSTGPHLHLEVLLNSNHVDPQIFLANYFGTGTNTSRIAAVKTKTSQKKFATVMAKRKYPEINGFSQVSYSDYVKSVDGLFGFSAPQSFTY